MNTPHFSPLPDDLPRTPHYLQPLRGAHTPKVTSIPADEEKTSAGPEAWEQGGGKVSSAGGQAKTPSLSSSVLVSWGLSFLLIRPPAQPVSPGSALPQL